MDRPLTIALANSGRKWIGEIAHVAMLYEQLEALGHRPWIVCRRGFALEQRAAKAGWRHLALAFNNRFNPIDDGRDIARWTAWVRREGVDVIHCHRGKDHWLGCAVAKWTCRPLVRTRHVVMPIQHHPFNRWMYLKATDAVVCVSEATRSSFGSWADRLPKGRVILSAVDGQRFHPRWRSERWRSETAPAAGLIGAGGEGDRLWFGKVGRFQRIKGHTVFLKAARKVAQILPEARFLMAGEGGSKCRQQLQEQARQEGWGNRLVVAGYLEDLPTVLASLDVGVIASLGSEGSSRIALEMMASGLPLVATTVGGIPDIAQPSGAVRLIEPGDADAMAQAMLQWANDAAGRRLAGQRARAHIEANHRPEQWAERFVDLYRELIADS